jgi:EmrB/QacA subfamily drug resistance transporter
MFNLTEKNRKWWILFAMTSAISVIFIDITVLPVTLPTIQRTLGFSDLSLQWIVNAYTSALTVFVMAGGRLGDRYGRKKIFFLGQLLFTVGSTLCGLSYHEWWFIAFRVIQGSGAALLLPSSFAIVFSSFPQEQRGKAIGLFVSIGSVFLATGPFIGGIFTQYLSWRFVFWINLPVLFVGYLLARFSVPKSEKQSIPFDVVGFITFSLGITFLIVGLMETKAWGWCSPFTISFLLIGSFLLILLYKVDRKTNDPFIDFTLFKNRNFSGSLSSVFCTQFLLMVTIFWAMYFQNVLGFSPTQTGILSLLSNAPTILAAPVAGHLLDKKGPRLPVTLGFILVSGSLIWFTQILDQKNVPLLLSALIPFGVGIPFILTPSSTTAIAEIPAERRGLATATLSMIRQFGATLGLAILGTIFLDVQWDRFAEDLKRNTETFHMSYHPFQGLLSKKPEAVKALQTLSIESQYFVTGSYTNSYIDAFSVINVTACFIALIGLVLALILIRKRAGPKVHM